MKAALIPLFMVLVLCSGCTETPKPAAPSVTPVAAQTQRQTADQVRAHLARAVQDAPDDPYVLLELALFDLQVNAVERAESGLRECWQKFPRFARAPYHLGMLYLLQGRETLAVAPLRAAAELDREAPLVQYNAGVACQRVGLEKQARAYAEAALRLDPLRAEPYLLLARLDDHPGTIRLAQKHLDHYLERSADPAPGYFMKGRMYARASDYANAELWLKRAIEKKPDDPDFWTVLGRIYTELESDTRTEEGLKCFQKALEINPGHAETHRYLGLALNRLHRYEEAIPHLQSALIGKESGPVYYDLGQALLKVGRTQEGQAVLAKYREYREYTEGIARLNKALQSDPNNRDRHYALIRFCLKYHQYGAAQAAVAQASKSFGADDTLRGFATEIESAANASRPSSPLDLKATP